MDSLSRLRLIYSHTTGHLSFPKETSLDEYRLRGSQFDTKALYNYYYKLGLPFYNEIFELFRNIQALNHDNDFNLSKSEKRAKGIDQITSISHLIVSKDHDHFESPLRIFVLSQVALNFDMATTIRGGVHFYLYADALYKLGTAKHRPLIDKALNFREYGCFALTELGHGSNVAALGTTAHYVKETREFVINTPNSLATKWWIGGAANTSSRTVVFAQLYVNGEHKGLNAFAVPIRDQNTHKPLPGVIIGDCGKKFENDGIDNGFIIFKDYRVGYDCLLDKFNQIDEKGKFVSSIKKKEKRVSTMLGALFRGRSSVVMSSEGNLKNALTIGVRWAAIRKQFGPPNSPEASILDYHLTRIRLVPFIANLFAIQSALEIISNGYETVSKKSLEDPDSVEVTEFHAILSAIKALATEWSFAGIHECRKICGGIGYSSVTRLGTLLASQDVNLTWEGDNHVLLQQSAGFVTKQALKYLQGNPSHANSISKIEISLDKTSGKKFSGNLTNIKDLITIYEHLFNVLIGKSLKLLQKKATVHEKYFDVWNNSQYLLQQLGKVYGVLQITHQWFSHLHEIQNTCVKAFEVVSSLLKIFIIEKLLQYKAELIIDGYLNEGHIEGIENEFESLCNTVGESSVKIIDSIANDDRMHGSPIGCKDGDSYNRLAKVIEEQKDCYELPEWLPKLRLLTNKS